jgi:hypothetical protein
MRMGNAPTGLTIAIIAAKNFAYSGHDPISAIIILRFSSFLSYSVSILCDQDKHSPPARHLLRGKKFVTTSSTGANQTFFVPNWIVTKISGENTSV